MSDLKLNFDKSWINIFNKYEIISKVKKNGYMDITADHIKAVEGKEPRNLTKIDFRAHCQNQIHFSNPFLKISGRPY